MAFKKRFEEEPEEDQLNILHKTILRVAQELKKKHPILNTLTLFKYCCKKLPNPEPEIDQAIRDLLRMKYIIEGKKLLREDILANEKRLKIYKYIIKNPGAHKREIRSVFKLGAFMVHRHLGFLEEFGFLRKKKFRNKVAYFDVDSDKATDQQVLVLRNETSERIYNCIQEHNKLRLVEIEKILQIPYATIQLNVNQLIKASLIMTLKEGAVTYYVLPSFPIEKEIKMKPRIFNIFLLGDDGVGKTSFHKYCDNSVVGDYRETIGVNLGEKKLTINATPIKLVVWDIENQAKFDSVLPHFYKEVDGIILMYDLTDSKTFIHLPDWLEKVSKYVTKSPIIALIGNKADLHEKRVITKEQGEQLSIQSPSIAFFEESSTQTGRNIDIIYETISKAILEDL